jgi:hypothetical protein
MRRLLAGALAASLIAAGCLGDDEGANDQAQGGSDDPSTVETSTGTDSADTAPAPEPPAEGEVLGRASGSYVQSYVELTELRRTSPEVVTAEFRITVPADAEDNFQVSDRLASEEDGFERGQDRVSGATLTDEAGGKRYFVLTDSDADCLCSTNIAGDGFIDEGTSVDLYAKFPAPPEDVAEVSFQVPTFQSIDGVQISE